MGRPSKICAVVMQLVEGQMQRDDETTAVQLHALLQHNGIDIIENHTAVPHTTWMDILWKCLLPANTRGQQREAVALGQGELR